MHARLLPKFRPAVDGVKATREPLSPREGPPILALFQVRSNFSDSKTGLGYTLSLHRKISLAPDRLSCSYGGALDGTRLDAVIVRDCCSLRQNTSPWRNHHVARVCPVSIQPAPAGLWFQQSFQDVAGAGNAGQSGHRRHDRSEAR